MLIGFYWLQRGASLSANNDSGKRWGGVGEVLYGPPRAYMSTWKHIFIFYDNIILIYIPQSPEVGPHIIVDISFMKVIKECRYKLPA